MKKVIVLIGIYLGLWGILGFFATIILGFLSCCIGLSQEIYFGALISFMIVAIIMICHSVLKCSKRPIKFS